MTRRTNHVEESFWKRKKDTPSLLQTTNKMLKMNVFYQLQVGKFLEKMTDAKYFSYLM